VPGSIKRDAWCLVVDWNNTREDFREIAEVFDAAIARGEG